MEGRYAVAMANAPLSLLRYCTGNGADILPHQAHIQSSEYPLLDCRLIAKHLFLLTLLLVRAVVVIVAVN